MSSVHPDTAHPSSVHPGEVIYMAPYRPDQAMPAIRHIHLTDLVDCLRKGWDDFAAMPTHAIMLVLIYPVLGLVLARLAFGYAVLPLLFPLAAGFALLGPFAAVGLYELSRRREAGETPSASDAMNVLSSPSFGAMLGLGMLLLVLFGVWIAVAQTLYVALFGYAPAASIPDFLAKVLTTPKGWTLIVVGCGIGMLFAIVALCVSVVAFPLMLDRHASMPQAMLASVQTVTKNPIPMMAWGGIVAVLLVLGSLPAFLGLTVVIPVLGHATWHLYRTAIVPAASPYPRAAPAPKPHRYAADFPVNLVSWMWRD